MLRLDESGLNTHGSYSASNVLRGGAAPIGYGCARHYTASVLPSDLKLIDRSCFPRRLRSLRWLRRPWGRQAHVGLQAAEGITMYLCMHAWEIGRWCSGGWDLVHAYTQAGHYSVTVSATGLSGRMNKTLSYISVTGAVVPMVQQPSREGAVQRG